MAVPAQRNITSGKNLSYWIDSVTPLEFETLEEDIKADVVVIGAGISGLTTAYCLLERGFEVVVLEDGCIGSGETGRTTAHLTYAVDEGYLKIRHMFGIEESRKVAESHRAAIDKMEEIVRKEHIDCNFRRINGYLFLHPSGKSESLEEEFLATQEIELPTYFSEAPPPGILPEAGSCIVYPRQATFHIMQYLQGLANAVKGKGGRIFTRTRAEKIAEGSVTANGRTVTTSHIVVATNTPVNDKITMHTKQYAYRTYVIGALIDKDALPDALWWDTGDVESKWRTDPYHYARKEPYNHTHDLLIVGGEDHKTGQAESEHIPEEKRYDALTEWTRRYFPAAREIVYQWSGQVMEPVDYLAFIGKNPHDKHTYIITGDSGNGMTHGTMGGIIVSDLIQGIENPWAKVYDPARKPVRVPGGYIRETFNMALQYTERLKRIGLSDIDALKPGEGGIVSKGLRKFAVYRDEGNRIHAFSAVCPHLGCVLHWNADEKTFDCPCHGSRFTKAGVVVNGPALTNLKPIDFKE